MRPHVTKALREQGLAHRAVGDGDQDHRDPGEKVFPHRSFPLLFLPPGLRSRISQLSADPAGRDSHDHRLNCPELVFRYALILGHAKVVLHSGIASHGHRGGEFEHGRCLRTQDFAAVRNFAEVLEQTVLLLR